MSEFWIWFLRPVGEFLGTIALIAGLFAAVILACFIYFAYCVVVERAKKAKAQLYRRWGA